MFALVNFHMEYSKTEGNPCSLDHLVNSHFILLKLVNDANDNLGILVGSYFGSQVRPIMSNIHWPQGIIYGIIYHKVKEYSFFIDGTLICFIVFGSPLGLVKTLGFPKVPTEQLLILVIF